MTAAERVAARKRAASRRRYARMRAAGQCWGCGGPVGVSRSSIYCECCYFVKAGPSRRGPCLKCGRRCNLDPTQVPRCWRCRWGK